MDERRHPSPCSTDELLHLTAEKRQRLIEKAAMLKRNLRRLAAELSAYEESIDELDRTERLLVRENMARLERNKFVH